MYAVIANGGKQYRVQKGDTIKFDYDESLDLGAEKKFDVMAVGAGAELKIGQPLVSGAAVKAEVVAVEKGPKIEILRHKRRKQFKRNVGFRALHTRMLITEVNDGASADALSAKEKEEVLNRVGFALVNELKAEESAEKKAAKVEKAKAKRAKKAAAPKPAVKKKAKTTKKKKATKKAASKKKTAKKATAKKKKTAKKTTAKKKD